MAETNSWAEEPEPKRRKVRKGTQSCRDCRRRKVRCIFTAPTDTICNACERRGIECISQEVLDEPSLSSDQVQDRLGRVERLLEQLVSNAGTTNNQAHPLGPFSEDHSTCVALDNTDNRFAAEAGSPTNHTSNHGADILTPIASQAETPITLGPTEHSTVVCTPHLHLVS